MVRLGIDLGGTKIEIAVLGPDNEAIWRKRVPTGREKGYEAILTHRQKPAGRFRRSPGCGVDWDLGSDLIGKVF
jgi:predicted NBD/HSP70 family sugar kinase